MEGTTHDSDLADVTEIRRAETGVRILLTLLFFVIAGVLRTIIVVLAVFEILYALVLKRTPGLRVREFANAVITYRYRIGRYITYNEATVPFPFSAMPEVLEPAGSPHEEEEVDLRELLEDDER